MGKYLDEILLRAERDFENFVDEEAEKGRLSGTERERAERFFSEELFCYQPLFKERFYLSKEKRAKKVLTNA